MTVPAPKVLAGYRVIEHGEFITGPYTALLLADMGAEVIKVERPGTGRPVSQFRKRSVRTAIPGVQP
jgi:crotonobetainyl-CoA:carnitine CoA-transferase CaiB-like acyl-CoA transferase